MDIIYSVKKEMLRRNYSQRTIESYCFCINKFLDKHDKNPRKITKKEIKDYLDDLFEKGKSGSTINLYISSIKFLFEEVLHRRIFVNIKYSRRAKKFPPVLTQEETKMLFNAIENKEHKLMIKLIYSAGLRVSELVNLKVKDLELDKGYGWIRKGKGNKDRVFVIAESLNELLKNKTKDLDYEDYIFKSNKKKKYSTRSLQLIIKKATKRTGIKKNVHCHTLRHSFATHLVENGYSVQDVQNLLGHNSSQTTMMYIHMVKPVINIKSPIDNL